MLARARSSARAHSTCNVKQTKRLSTIQPRVTSVVRFANNSDLQALIAAAVQQQDARFKAELQQQDARFKAELQQQDAQSKAELQRKLRPFQQEFILNTVNELGKLVLLGLQPSKRETTYANYSQPARLKKLARNLKMSPQKMFEGIAVKRNSSTHAGSLQALRTRVTDALEMIDELVAADPTLFVTDVNLSFSRDVLALYDTIESDFLRSGRR